MSAARGNLALVAVAGLSGLLFGGGLSLGGMTDPARVRGFLDLFGEWDPTLAFVMGGAVLVMAVAWLLQRRMQHPFFDTKFSLPDRSDITSPLVGGAVLFGIGWGMAGLCPGPGIANLAMAPVEASIFVVSLLAGMAIHKLALD